MNRTLNHPWNELDRAWNMFDQVFRNPIGTGASSRGKFPKVQTWSRDDHYAVTAELPGVELDAVNIVLRDGLFDQGEAEVAHGLVGVVEGNCADAS